MMIVLLLWVFGIMLTLFLKDDDAFATDFGTLYLCVYTLLIRGVFLDNMSVVFDELLTGNTPGSIVSIIIFLVFILLATITIMNMLIGVLCEVVTGVAAAEKEDAAVRLMKHTIFLELKKFDDGDGDISEDELNELMGTEASAKVLEELGIDIN